MSNSVLVNFIVYPKPDDSRINLNISSARLFADKDASIALREMDGFILNTLDEAGVESFFKALDENQWTVTFPGGSFSAIGDNYIFVDHYDAVKSYCHEQDLVCRPPTCTIL